MASAVLRRFSTAADETMAMEESVFTEIRIWEVPRAVKGSTHALKYSLALVVDGACVLRYDNEAGKGDHRHDVDGKEWPCPFRGVEALIEDFWTEVDTWRAGRTGEPA